MNSANLEKNWYNLIDRDLSLSLQCKACEFAVQNLGL